MRRRCWSRPFHLVLLAVVLLSALFWSIIVGTTKKLVREANNNTPHSHEPPAEVARATATASITASSSSSSSSSSSPTELERERNVERDVIRETTRILYESSERLEYWLSQPPPTVYIYDTLAVEFSIESVSRCIDERYNSGLNRARCGWEPKVCDENSTSDSGPYNVFRDNFNSDVVLMSRFVDYAHVTRNPNEADFFFVPYPHKSHCFCKNDDPRKIYSCSYPFRYIQENVLDGLPHYNATSKDRHLFILGSDFSYANPPFRREVPLHVTTGPADGCRPNRHSRGKPPEANCGSLTIPFVNTDAAYQPSILHHVRMSDDDNEIDDRNRGVAIAAVMGTPKQLGIRREFMQRKEELFQGGHIQGRPVVIWDIGGANRFLAQHSAVMDLYRNSTFCPVLPGDDCGQKRFFDVVFNGCLPVVLSYDVSDEPPQHPSFFKPRACSIRRSYPFARGTFHNDSRAGIDVSDFVVPVNGTCGLPCLKPTLESVLSDPRDLARRRKALRRVAPLYSYGMVGTPKHPDAFSALLVSIRHYLAHLPPIQQTTPTEVNDKVKNDG